MPRLAYVAPSARPDASGPRLSRCARVCSVPASPVAATQVDEQVATAGHVDGPSATHQHPSGSTFTHEVRFFASRDPSTRRHESCDVTLAGHEAAFPRDSKKRTMR
jgi:hypothetical protein